MKWVKEDKFTCFYTKKDPSAKKAQGINEIFHEILILMKFLQTQPQNKVMNIFFMICIILLFKTEIIKK